MNMTPERLSARGVIRRTQARDNSPAILVSAVHLSVPCREGALEEHLVEERPLAERRRQTETSAPIGGGLSRRSCLTSRPFHLIQHQDVAVVLGSATESAVARNI